MSDHDEPEDRQQEILSAVLKFLGITAVVGLVIWIGTTVVVNSLDLDEVSSGPVTNSAPFAPLSPLPTAAIPDPTRTPTPSATPTEDPSDFFTEVPTEPPTPTDEPDGAGADGLVMNVAPVFVEAGERIDITGQWPGKDNVSLFIQRLENGEWTDFGVQVQVRLGSFATYVLTSREGENRFRVYDPATDTASNAVTVTVD